MNIFYKYSHLRSLTPSSGDQINEINTLKALRKFANVYYGYSPMVPNISIIRASKEAFRKAKGKRLWMASPYDKGMFEQADLIFTFTDTWTKWLKEGKKFSLNPEGIAWGDKVVTFPQTVGDGFVPKKMNVQTSQTRIGLFGRNVASTYPTAFLNNIDYFMSNTPLFVIKGYNNEQSRVPYQRVPDMIRGCDIILVGQHGAEWEFCGNIKPIEAAACGVPVILERSEAREHTFGKNYPGFVDRGTMKSTKVSARNEIRDRIRFFRGTHPYVGNILANVADKHRIEQTSKVLEEILTKIL